VLGGRTFMLGGSTDLRELAPGTLADGVTLSWTDNADNEDGFIIERSGNNEPFVVIESAIGANQTTYTDTDTEEDVIYVYRVAAVNSGGQSAYTNIADALLTGIDEVLTRATTIAPNPSSGLFRVLVNDNSVAGLTATVWSTDGRRVFTQEVTPSGNGFNFALDLSSQPEGTYLLFLNTDNGRRVMKRLLKK